MRRFFCENCGAEVSERDELCSSCGAFFVAIKCPRCGFRGKQHRFTAGCPECGYLGDERTVITTTQPRTAVNEEEDRAASAMQTGERHRRVRRYAEQGARMPSWTFWLVVGFMVVSFLLLARIYATL